MMTGFRKFGSYSWSRVSRWGTLFGITALFGLSGANFVCFPPTPVTPVCDPACPDGQACFRIGSENVCRIECTADDVAPCDDANLCTTDTCNAGGYCDNAAVVCDTAGQVCDPDTGDCIAPECAEDAECDNSNFCDGTETCAGGICEAGTSPCQEGETCNEDTDACEPTPECVEDADCDDALFCTGAETCVAGACVDGTSPCQEGQECVEELGECITICVADVDCDDASACTTDTCVAGVCLSEDVVCEDDADLCTTEACDPATGCASTPVDCPDGQSCDPATGECVTTACVTDADCTEDGFCNGTMACVEGACTNGARPCDDADGDGNVITCDLGAAESCAEGDTEAVCTACPTDEINFTLGQDDLPGTTGDDTFSAPLEFSPGAGAQVATLQTGDNANGLAGNDTLDAALNGTNATPTLDGIEILDFSVFDANTTISANNIAGAAEVNSRDSTNLLTVNNVQNIVDLGLFNTDAGMTVSWPTIATNTAADVLDITVSDTSGGTLTFTTAVNGFETVNVTSTGGAANELDDLTQNVGTSVTTINFTGDQGLEITGELNDGMANLTTVNGGGGTITGPLKLTFDDAPDRDLTVTGGSGDDEFDFTDSFDKDDTVDGGEGTDMLILAMKESVTTAVSVSNVEKLRLTGNDDGTAEAFEVDFGGVAGLTTVQMEALTAGSLADTLTLDGLAIGSGITLDFRGDGTDANQLFDNVVFDFAGATGTADPITMTIGNREQDLNQGSRTVTIATINTDLVENATLTNSDGGDVTITTWNGTALKSLTITSANKVTVTNVLTSTAVATVDGSAVTDNLDIDASNSIVDCTMDGGTKLNTLASGSGDDTINGGADKDTLSGNGGADDIDGKAEIDTINGGDGIDDVTTGTGSDIVQFDALNVDATDADRISDFTPAANGDVIAIDVSAAGGGVAANLTDAALTNIQASANNSFIVDAAGLGYASFALAEAAVQADNAATLDYALMFYNTANTRVELYIDADSSAAGAGLLLASFTDQSTDALADIFLAAFVASNYDTY